MLQKQLWFTLHLLTAYPSAGYM